MSPGREGPRVGVMRGKVGLGLVGIDRACRELFVVVVVVVVVVVRDVAVILARIVVSCCG